MVLLMTVTAWIHYRQETVLEFGMFTGSNWNVASANSFVIFDKAIARFEKEHPGVKIHYYSGISKDDYSRVVFQKTAGGKGTGCVYGAGHGF